MKKTARIGPVLLACVSLVIGCVCGSTDSSPRRGYVRIAYLLSPGDAVQQKLAHSELAKAKIIPIFIGGSLADGVDVKKKDSKKARTILREAARNKGLLIEMAE